MYDANEPWVLMRYITAFGLAAADGWAVSKQGYVPAIQGDVVYRLILPGGANAAPRAAGPAGGADDAGVGDEGGDEAMEEGG